MSSSEEPPIRSEDTQLHELLVLVLDRIAEHGLSGASAILEQHPAHADELRRRLRKLQAAGLLPSPEGAEEELPERLGDFRLLRPIGSGGMGIVYLARQESLGRDVALKLVRPDQLFFPGARERFRREVEAIARLQDPGIVAIHTVGEESGIPFFAMEYVEGATLTELVLQLQGRRPSELRGADLLHALRRQVSTTATSTALPTEFAGSWPDACVRVLAHVARAVAHAHAHGVLHRDLKSANVMLRQDGRPVVLDFGLAQPRGASRLTRTGAPLGTLHAMAPEQLRAEHDAVDERTDVYALGVLFYELLALRPPFVGSSYDVVARQILDANPPLPSRLNAGVTWDCETVCLTAMEPEPARRYPSANALLRDLENLLTRRPIEARRPGPWLRLRRFAQRHRGLTGAFAIVLLALFVVPIVIAVRERGLNAELSEAVARAQGNVAAAASGLNELLREMADERLDLVPDLGGFNQRLTIEVARQVETLLDTNPLDFATRLDFAEALQRVAIVRWGIRDQGEAAALFSRAIGLVETLPEVLDAGIAERRDFLLLDCGLSRAVLQRSIEDPAAYAAAVQHCLDAVERVTPIERRPPHFRARFSTGLERLATDGSNAASDSAALLRRSLELRRSVAAELDDLRSWLDVVATYQLLYQRLRGGDPAAADECVRVQQQLLLELAGRSDGNLEARRELAGRLIALADAVAAKPEGREEGIRLARRAVGVFDEVGDGRPSRVQLQIDGLQARRDLGLLLRDSGRTDEFREVLEVIIADTSRLTSTWPDRGAAWLLLLSARRQMFDVLLARGEVQAADALVSVLVADGRRAVGVTKERAIVAFELYEALALQAGVAVRHGRIDEAKALLQEAFRASREASKAAAEEHVGLGQSDEYFLAIAGVELAKGERQRALAMLTRISTLPFDPRLRLPQLRELADDPAFVSWLARVREAR